MEHEKLTVEDLRELIQEYDDDVEIWVSLEGLTGPARSSKHVQNKAWGAHITISGDG